MPERKRQEKGIAMASSADKRKVRLPTELEKQLEALARMPDADIDMSDMPEALDWSPAVVGAFYRPVKQQLTLRTSRRRSHQTRSNGRSHQTRSNGRASVLLASLLTTWPRALHAL